MPTEVSVSVVVPTYNRGSALALTIDALLASPCTRELVVVVDGCRDGSIEFLEQRSCGDDRIKPFYVDNRGEAAARQYGVERATGSVVVLVDDDVVIRPGVIEAHAKYHAHHEGCVLLGYMPVTLPARRRARDFYRYYYHARYEEHVMLWQAHPEAILAHFWAGHFSLRRTDALAVGLADPTARLEYHADYYFGLRCIEAGLVGHFDRRLDSEHLFERTVSAFARDAYLQGVARVRLEQLRTGTPGAGRCLLKADGGVQKLLVSATRSERLAVCLGGTLQLAMQGAGRLRWFEAQTTAARKLQRVNQLRGVRAGLNRDLELGPRVR